MSLSIYFYTSGYTMKKAIVIAVLALIAVGGGLYFFCCGKKPESPAPAKIDGFPKNINALSDILAASKGRSLILLLGIEGCPGTRRATADMTKLASNNPQNVALLRLDVPTTDGKFQPVKNWSGAFPQRIDTIRAVATELDFVYYPTIYIFDPNGNKRFAGGYDADNVAAILDKIAANPADTTDYSVKHIEIGADAPIASLQMLDGKTATLDDLKGEKGLVVFFGTTTCPYSVEEMKNLKSLSAKLAELGVKLAVVNMRQPAAKIAKPYNDKAPGIPVLVDADGAYSAQFGVDAVPFFYMLDSDLVVCATGAFAVEAVLDSARAMLGMETSGKQIDAAGG